MTPNNTEAGKSKEPVTLENFREHPDGRAHLIVRDSISLLGAIGDHEYTEGDIIFRAMERWHEYAQSREQPWRDVNGSFPKESGRYLCYCAEQNDLGLGHFIWNCAYSFEENRWSDGGKSIFVTHWMPIPAPPIK